MDFFLTRFPGVWRMSPAPTPIEPGGTIPHHLNPPPLSQEKDIQRYTHISGIGYRWQLPKKHRVPLFLVFSGNLPETTAKNTGPPFQRKWERACGLPYAFEWGGGGAYEANILTMSFFTTCRRILIRTIMFTLDNVLMLYIQMKFIVVPTRLETFCCVTSYKALIILN